MQGLYLVTDNRISSTPDLLALVRAAVAGGVRTVQLREKEISTRAYLERALALRQLLDGKNITLIINDRIDIALAAEADGVHLGQDDMPYVEARRLMGPGKLIGLSVETVEQVAQANTWDVDYLGAGPVFATPTKPDTAAPLGIETLQKLRAASCHPMMAIGGIDASNAAAVMQTGVAGLAVVSAVSQATDPQAAAADLASIITAHGGSS